MIVYNSINFISNRMSPNSIVRNLYVIRISSDPLKLFHGPHDWEPLIQNNQTQCIQPVLQGTVSLVTGNGLLRPKRFLPLLACLGLTVSYLQMLLTEQALPQCTESLPCLNPKPGRANIQSLIQLATKQHAGHSATAFPNIVVSRLCRVLQHIGNQSHPPCTRTLKIPEHFLKSNKLLLSHPHGSLESALNFRRAQSPQCLPVSISDLPRKNIQQALIRNFEVHTTSSAPAPRSVTSSLPSPNLVAVLSNRNGTEPSRLNLGRKELSGQHKGSHK